MKLRFVIVAGALILASVPILSAQSADSSQTFRVELKRVDGKDPMVFSGFYFDEKDVTATLSKYPVKLPQPMPPDAKLGYFYGGPIYALLQKIPGQTKIRLTLDANANFDLTDDLNMELAPSENRNGIVVKFARRFESPQPRTEWLPYKVSYDIYKNREGKDEDSISVSANYDFEGAFRLNGREYDLILDDGDAQGRFIREKLSNVFLHIREKDSKAPSRGRRFFELIPIEDAFYEVKSFAEDGSWIEFAKSHLPKVALGKPAADMELTDTTGRAFKLSDYKDKLILLDFWPGWCVPCVAEFDEIKKTLAQYANRPLAVLGINIDEAARLEKAKKIVADKNLTWPQIMDGKGEFIPVYQVYGRLPEHENSFPIYVAIDRKGITRYATNAWNNMARFLAAELRDEKNGTEDLFIPLAGGMGMKTLLSDPVDFSPAVVEEFLKIHPAKLPPNLPPAARIGLMSSDTLVILWPGAKPNAFNLIVDANRDFDLVPEKIEETPVFDKADLSSEEAKKIQIITSYQNGGRSFYPFFFFVRPAKDNGFPQLFFFGTQRDFTGSILAGNREYQLTVTDPTPDMIFTNKDWTRPGLLKLSEKKDGKWAEIHSGTTGIPINGRLYRLRLIQDDGSVIELEPEK